MTRRILLCCLPAVCLTIAAQEVHLDIVGTIQTQDRQAIAGARVVARHIELGIERRTISNAKGHFVLGSLPIGPYDILIIKDGFRPEKVMQTLAVNSAPSLHVTLAAADYPKVEAEASATVTVTAKACPLDENRASSSKAISPDDMKNLPMLGRNFLDYAQLAPGVQSVQRGNLGMIGQRAVSTGLLIDGCQIVEPNFSGMTGSVENSAPYTFSMESIREFEIVTAGAPAEYGQMAGGYVNAITKSGTNTPTGSVFFYDQPSGLKGRDPNTGAPADGFSNTQFGFSMGGPIIKDQLFYFFSYEGQRETTPIQFRWGGNSSPVTLNPAIPADAALLSRENDYNHKSNSDVFFGRLDWYANTENWFSLRVNLTRFKGDTGVGVSTASSDVANYSYDGTASDDSKTASAAFQWTWFPTSKLSNEFRLNLVEDDLPRDSRGSLPTIQIGNVGIYGSYPYPRAYHSERTQIFNATTYQVPGFKLRGGFDFDSTLVRQRFVPFANGAYTFASLQAFEAGMWSYYGQTVGVGNAVDDAAKMSARSEDLALFLQSDTEISQRLTIGLGLRWDEQRHPDNAIPDVSAGAASYGAPGSNALDGHIPVDRAISPRTLFTWTPEPATVVRGSWGMYVSRTPSVYDYEAIVGNRPQLALHMIPGGPGGPLPWGPTFNPNNPSSLSAPVGVVLPPTLYTFAPDFKNPRTSLFNLAVEHTFGPWVLGLSGIYARTTHLERIQDQNLGSSTQDADGRQVFPATRPNQAWGPMYVFVSDLESRYQSLTTSGKYSQPGSPWTVEFSWCWSKDRDSDSNERTLLGFHEQNTQRPQDDWAYSDRDRRHVVIVTTTYLDQKWTGIQTGVIARYMTGTPYSAIKTSDLNNDGMADNDRVLGTSRNQFRTAAILNFDFHLSRDWFFAGQSKLTPSIDIFNFFNHHEAYNRTRAIADVPDNAPVQLETFREDDSIPRSCQIGIRYTW